MSNLDWKTCSHNWDIWKTLYYQDFPVAYASIRACKICQAREFNDWCSIRTGNEFKVLPPENENNSL
jgi:hypothetical protein